MNKGLIFGLGALAGGGIGTGVTFLVLKRKVNREKESEIEEVRAYYKKKIKEMGCKDGEILEKSDKKEVKSSPKEDKQGSKDVRNGEKLAEKVGLAERDTVSIGRKKVQDSNHTDYTKFSKVAGEYTGNEAKVLFSYPHAIDEAEFDHDPDYKKVILTWYETDDILADVNDSPSEYTVEDFGYDNFSDFGFEGMIYLRNENSKTDFKIIYEPTLSFDEATGGVHLNDP